MTFHCTAIGDSIQEIEGKLTRDCKTVSTWMKSNRLKLNPDKTHLLTIGTQRKLSMLPHKLSVSMDGVMLQESGSGYECLLGCLVQPTLKWNYQVTSLLVKLKTRLGGLFHLQKICPFKVRKMIAEGIFNSTMNYCISLFGGMGKQNCNSIQILQNRAARFVCNLPPQTSRTELFTRVGWLTVNQMIRYHTLVLVYKIRRANDPEYLAKHLCRDNRNQLIMIPKHTQALFDDSFCQRGSSHWNQLPFHLRTDPKLESFKIGLNKWIKEKVPQFLE